MERELQALSKCLTDNPHAQVWQFHNYHFYSSVLAGRSVVLLRALRRGGSWSLPVAFQNWKTTALLRCRRCVYLQQPGSNQRVAWHCRCWEKARSLYLGCPNSKACSSLPSYTLHFAAANTGLHNPCLWQGHKGALLTPEPSCGAGYVPVTFLGKEAHANGLERSQRLSLRLVDQHRHWMHRAAYGAHRTATPTHPRSLLASSPGSPWPSLLFQQRLMRCGGFPYICL